jgi:hypothetical protein
VISDAADSTIPPIPLQDVHELRLRHQGQELPGFLPYQAKGVDQKFNAEWNGLIQVTLDNVKELMQDLVEQTVNDIFKRFSCGHALMSILQSRLDTVAKNCSRRLKELARMELSQPFTLNSHYYLDSKAKFTGKLKEAFLGRFGDPDPTPAILPTSFVNESQLLGNLMFYGMKCSSIRDMFLSQQTEFDAEIDMAACLAYYKVVYKRVLNGVPMHIHSYFIKDFFYSSDGPSLSEHAYTSLVSPSEGLSGSKRARSIADLLEEELSVAHKRLELQDKKTRLEKAVRILRDPLVE